MWGPLVKNCGSPWVPVCTAAQHHGLQGCFPPSRVPLPPVNHSGLQGRLASWRLGTHGRVGGCSSPGGPPLASAPDVALCPAQVGQRWARRAGGAGGVLGHRLALLPDHVNLVFFLSLLLSPSLLTFPSLEGKPTSLGLAAVL